MEVEEETPRRDTHTETTLSDTHNQWVLLMLREIYAKIQEGKTEFV